MDSNTRTEVLSAIRSQLPAEKIDYPVISDLPTTITALLTAFEARLQDAGAALYKPASNAAARELLAQQFPDARVICSTTPDLPGNRDIQTVNDPQELAVADVGVIRARLGVAENGMVWLTEDDLGFVPQHLVILLSPAAIVANMYDAYLRVYLEDSAYGCFIMGPSATADIGAVLVHGAQGARSLSVYLL